jgi:hypothetical protein
MLYLSSTNPLVVGYRIGRPEEGTSVISRPYSITVGTGSETASGKNKSFAFAFFFRLLSFEN